MLSGMALNSTCEHCHVHCRRRRLNTHLCLLGVIQIHVNMKESAHKILTSSSVIVRMIKATLEPCATSVSVVLV